MNKCIFMGRLTGDPEIRYTQDGKPVVRFNFAVNRTYKREGEPEADFFSCAVFGNAAERFEKLHIQKGVKLVLEGEIRNNNYTDRNGVKRYENQVNVNNFEFCESKGSSVPAQPSAPIVAASPQTRSNDGFVPLPDDVEDEGLPFN